MSTSGPVVADRGLHPEPLIPARNRGIICSTVRRPDLAARTTAAPYGSSGSWPDRRTGYKEVEFAATTSTSTSSAAITPVEIRKILDATGWSRTVPTPRIDPATFEAQRTSPRRSACETSAPAATRPTRTTRRLGPAADVWNELGRQPANAAAAIHPQPRGRLLVPARHRAAGRPGPPTRRRGCGAGVLLRQGRPAIRVLRAGIYWAYVARFRVHTTPTAGATRERPVRPDPQRRLALQAVPAVPRQGRRPGRDPGQRYVMVPLGEGDINFQQFFETIGDPDVPARQLREDNAPGGATNPAQSCFAALSTEHVAATIYKGARPPRRLTSTAGAAARARPPERGKGPSGAARRQPAARHPQHHTYPRRRRRRALVARRPGRGCWTTSRPRQRPDRRSPPRPRVRCG